MASFVYEKVVSDLWNKIIELDFCSNKDYRCRFDITSASFRNYLPDIDFSHHLKLFKEILFYQKLSLFDQSDLDILSRCHVFNFEKYFIKAGEVRHNIFCTFHTGSYRVVNHFLASKKIKYSLVVSRVAASTQKDDFVSLYNKIYSASTNDQLDVLYAEDPRSFFKMVKILKDGGNLLFYIDGNIGVNNSNKNVCEINFLSQKILARSGIAFLSHLTQTPIFPVISYRKNVFDINLLFEEPICSFGAFSRNDYILYTTTRLYNLLASVIISYPSQWEGWLYLHKSAKVCVSEPETEKNIKKGINSEEIRGLPLQLNVADYSLFDDGIKYYIFKKVGYLFFEINQELYRLLEGISDKKLDKKFDPNLLSELIQKKVLITN